MQWFFVPTCRDVHTFLFLLFFHVSFLLCLSGFFFSAVFFISYIFLRFWTINTSLQYVIQNDNVQINKAVNFYPLQVFATLLHRLLKICVKNSYFNIITHAQNAEVPAYITADLIYVYWRKKWTLPGAIYLLGNCSIDSKPHSPLLRFPEHKTILLYSKNTHHRPTKVAINRTKQSYNRHLYIPWIEDHGTPVL